MTPSFCASQETTNRVGVVSLIDPVYLTVAAAICPANSATSVLSDVSSLRFQNFPSTAASRGDARSAVLV